jgi:RimJ/RimL family protein N-acetyltransferase
MRRVAQASNPTGGERELRDYVPLFGLEVRTPMLTMSMPTDPELVELVGVIERGVHDPSFMPFRTGWTDVPSPQRERESLAHWWRYRAEWSAQNWHWCGAVRVDGHVAGAQDVWAKDFDTLHEVSSGSFVGLEYQGRGIGKEMRTAALHLAFAGLGAERAYSGYLEGNEPSRRVSESLGYVANGYGTVLVRGEAVREIHLVLEREAWESRRRDDITVVGLDACRALFGVTD